MEEEEGLVKHGKGMVTFKLTVVSSNKGGFSLVVCICRFDIEMYLLSLLEEQ